ncbi:MAG: glycosyltransferase family 2 protein [Actinomycetota bacterium]|nr:glycosyltransferase family 2 protein [Actinomycetota bacterium]
MTPSPPDRQAALRSTVIVVSYQPGRWLEPCLASVRSQADQVLLVDNGSESATVSRVGEATGVTVVRNNANLGFTGGVNAALPRAAGDLVALLNDDAVAGPSWLESAADVLEDPRVAAVGPKILFDGLYAQIDLPDEPYRAAGFERRIGRLLETVEVDGVDVLARVVGGLYEMERSVTQLGRRWRWTNGADPIHVPVPHDHTRVAINGDEVVPTRHGRVINNAGSCLTAAGDGGDIGCEAADDGRFDDPAERFAVTGAAMVARRQVFERLGGMDPDFFAYYEDLDWCWRARQQGLTLRYDPRTVVEHRRWATTEQAPVDQMTLIATRNRVLCLVNNAPLPAARAELERVVRHPPHPMLRRSLARHLPGAIRKRRARMADAVAGAGTIWAAWAGRDTTWGLASQRRDQATGPEGPTSLPA